MDSKIKQKLFMDCLEPIYDKLARYTRALTRNRHDAQDLLNETLLKTFENFDKVKSADKFTGYVFTIAKRTYTRNKWRRRFFGSYNEQEAEKIEDAGTSAETAIDVGVLYKALAKLPDKMKEAVILFEISGFSLNEICDIQNSSLSAVKSRVKRGREKLAEIMNVDEKKTNELYINFSKNGTSLKNSLYEQTVKEG